MDHRASLEAVEYRKILGSAGNRTPAVQPVVIATVSRLPSLNRAINKTKRQTDGRG
jgi:hypothetical protein